MVEAAPKKKAQKRFTTKYAAEVSEDMTPAERRKKLGKMYEEKRKQNRGRVKSRYGDHAEVAAAKTPEERRKILQKLYKRQKPADKKNKAKKKKKQQRPRARQADQDGMALPTDDEDSLAEQDEEEEEEAASEDRAGRAFDRDFCTRIMSAVRTSASGPSQKGVEHAVYSRSTYMLPPGFIAELCGWNNMRLAE